MKPDKMIRKITSIVCSLLVLASAAYVNISKAVKPKSKEEIVRPYCEYKKN